MMAWFDALIERRLFRRGAPLAILVLLAGVIAAGAALGTTTTCTTPPTPAGTTLAGSGFEIDLNANQVVNNTGCIDWLDTSTASGTQQDAIVKLDTTSGSTDESFGNGTKEDTAEPSVVDGGIPPNKSDLKAFGVFIETGEVTAGNPTGQFLELFWSRVQDPSGTTNMDFELNQKFCDLTATPTNCASNGITPLRTVGDKLITYDLSRGGTVATISIRTWDGSVWGPATVLTAQDPVQALGTINTTQITAANSLVGALSPRTFGEASISFGALFGDETCGQFGSAYLKSRASDSFTSALKDFVPPTRVDVNNCPALLTTTATAEATLGEPISDTAHLDTDANATGTITFHLFSDDQCANEVDTGLQPVTVNGGGDYNSGDFTPTTAGTYYWIAEYSGDATHDSAATLCGDPGETSVVNKAPSSVATEQELFPQDSATLSADKGGPPTGDVTFQLFGPSDPTCSGTPVIDETVALSNPTPSGDGGTSTASTSNTTFSVDEANDGNYKWVVTYEGDDTHLGVTSECGTEAFTATIDDDTTTP